MLDSVYIWCVLAAVFIAIIVVVYAFVRKKMGVEAVLVLVAIFISAVGALHLEINSYSQKENLINAFISEANLNLKKLNEKKTPSLLSYIAMKKMMQSDDVDLSAKTIGIMGTLIYKIDDLNANLMNLPTHLVATPGGGIASNHFLFLASMSDIRLELPVIKDLYSELLCNMKAKRVHMAFCNYKINGAFVVK